MRPRSLALRLVLAAGLWVAAGLGGTAWFVSGLAVRHVEAAFAARLAGLLDALVAATSTDADGAVLVTRMPAGADFDRPFGGAYWQITAPGGRVLTSRSLWDQSLPAAVEGHDGILLRDTVGPRGERLRTAGRDVVLPGAIAAIHVTVALARNSTEAEIARLRGVLLGVLGLLGAGLVAGVAVTVVAGLAPLRRVRRAVSQMRAGERARLDDVPAPSEIAPLIAELDALVVANRATVDRARTHLGNLAHALKTPLAVLRNALDASRPEIEVARAQAAALAELVNHHLARARADARVAESAGAGAAPHAIAEEIAGALRRLHADRGLALEIIGDGALRARIDVRDLAELLGNLMDNACKWARHRVRVDVRCDARTLAVEVEDDGPGLADEARAAVLARGVRLDETTPGSGLGLAIASDLATVNGGRLELGASRLGGLRVGLRLPLLKTQEPP